jgi:hypothetical protein
MPKTMTWEEFVATLKKDIDAFGDYWTKHHLDDPKNFPAKMGRGEWEEQFLVYDREKEEGACT